MTLLRLYLGSLVVRFQGNLYMQSAIVNLCMQSAIVCIGPLVALVLSKIYLLYIDRAVKHALQALHSRKLVSVFRCVIDYLIIHECCFWKANVTSALKLHGLGLQFIEESPSSNLLQFLDLHIYPLPSGLCWCCQQ